MSWTKEARVVNQTVYGHYVALCKRKNIEPVPYVNFTIDLFKQLKSKS
jgi:hypothetical protein